MSRSVIPKIRIPTVEELDSNSGSTKNNFAKFRQAEPPPSTASTSKSDQVSVSPPVPKRRHEEERDKEKEKGKESEEIQSVGDFSTSVPNSSESRVTGGGSSVIVNSRQSKNPLLRFLRNVRYEYGPTTADYLLGESCCALFLSLKFHRLHSDYVHERLKEVGHKYASQILLVQVDIPEPEQALRELNTICFNANWTMMLAWNPEEAAELLESYKIYENKPPDFLMGRQETDPRARLVDLLTAIKSITRTDAENLIVTFGSLKNMVEATEEQLAMCPGLGPKKAKRLFNAFGASWRVGADETLTSFTIDDGEGTSGAAALIDIDADDLFEGE